ncbi:hypothetical protein FPQ18DRAFT_352296 [Pyronema domesticum]|nr:hypothetical protein FPQ18DRAFT_352296 [Pyronema domesticum]
MISTRPHHTPLAPISTNKAAIESTSLVRQQIRLLVTVASFLGYLAALPFSYMSNTLLLQKRLQKARDAIFHEFMLLVFQPAAPLLILMWPGWIFIGFLWWFYN